MSEEGGDGGFPGNGGSGPNLNGKYLTTINMKEGVFDIQSFNPGPNLSDLPLAFATRLIASQFTLNAFNTATGFVQNLLTLSPDMFNLRLNSNESDQQILNEIRATPNEISIVHNENNTSNTLTSTNQTITKEKHTSNNAEVKNEKLEIKIQTIDMPEIKIEQTTTETTRTDINEPIITDEDGNEYSIADIMEMDLEHQLKLSSIHHQIPINSEQHQLTNISHDNRIVAQHSNTVESTSITPSHIEVHNMLSRPTNFNWSITHNNHTYTARNLEELSYEQLWNLDLVQDHVLIFLRTGNPETHETWTQIANYNNPNEVYAIIKYLVPATARFEGDHIEFSIPGMNSVFGVNGLRYEIEEEDGFSIVSVNNTGLDSQHIIRTYTYDTWEVPGLTPKVDANEIEMMNEKKRKELIDKVSEHGDILQFVPNENTKTGEKWNDIVYNGDVVARIDMTTTQHVNISTDEITIGNLSLNNGLVRFFSNSENVETIIGVVGAVALSAYGVNWSVHHPILAGAAIYVSWKGYKFVSKISSIVFAVPKYFLKKIFPRTLSVENEDEEEVEDGLKAIIDWATYDESTGDKVDVEIEMEDADKKVASLESCVKIAKAFRDTLKGPLAIMCEEIKNMKSNKPSIKEDETNLTSLEGYPEYYVKNDDVNPDSNDEYNILKFDIPEEIKTKCLQAINRLNMFKIILRKNVVYDLEGKYTKEFYI